MERYYVKVKGAEGSRVAHDTLAEAYTEARRLFTEKCEQSRRVYVLQVIGTIEPLSKDELRQARRLARKTAMESQQTMREGRQPTEIDAP